MPLFRKSPSLSHDRTSVERERERLERERRRAQRQGPAADAPRAPVAAQEVEPEEPLSGSTQHDGAPVEPLTVPPAEPASTQSEPVGAVVAPEAWHVAPEPSEPEPSVTPEPPAEPELRAGPAPSVAALEPPLAQAPAQPELAPEAAPEAPGQLEPELEAHVAHEHEWSQPDEPGETMAWSYESGPPLDTHAAGQEAHAAGQEAHAMGQDTHPAGQEADAGWYADDEKGEEGDLGEGEAEDQGAVASQAIGYGSRASSPSRVATASTRLPPPPTRREALLERRARRLHRHRSSARSATPLVNRGRIAVLAVILVLALAVWFLVSLFQPGKGAGEGQVLIRVPAHDGASAIGTLLASRGVVSSGFFFNLRARLEGKRGDLHSGLYTLRRDMSYSAAIGALLRSPPPPPVVKVLIPEGEARREIARLAQADSLSGSYLAASVRSRELSPSHYGAPRRTPSLEGFLFPATYDIRAGADARARVVAQLVAITQNNGPAEVHAARLLHVTPYQLLIVASMIEREAAIAADRPRVAAVIYNRLRDHIPLGIDATIRYALNNWTRPLTVSDLRIDSPYNTRTRQGLPPTPIGNPGVASITAAAHPARASYLYYVAGADGCGEQVFSSSFAQFQHDVALYQAAIARHGGRVPTCQHG